MRKVQCIVCTFLNLKKMSKILSFFIQQVKNENQKEKPPTNSMTAEKASQNPIIKFVRIRGMVSASLIHSSKYVFSAYFPHVIGSRTIV